MTGPFEVSRRRVMQILGVSSVGALGAGALASCSPGKADDTPTSGTTGTGTSTSTGGGSGAKGEIHVGYPYTAPPEGTFNIYASGAAAMIDVQGLPYGDMMHMPSAYYMWADGSWVKFLIEDNKLDEAANTYTLTLKKGLTWSDGSPLTAKDYVTSFYCNWLLSQPVWKYIKDVEAKDDTTVVVNLKDPSSVLERYILKMKVADHATYGAIADQVGPLIKAGKDQSDAAAAKLLEDLQKLAPKDALVSGPYKYDAANINNTQCTLVLNDKGYLADTVKFAKVVVYNGETPVVTPLIQSKTVDYATHGFPPSTEKAFQGIGIKILRPPNLSGPALYLNMQSKPEFKDKRVRQAFATLLDRDNNGQVSLADSGKGVKFMAGFSDNSLDQWLPAGVKDKLKKYEHSADEAAKLLTAAGWKKEGSNWKLPNGKDAKYEIAFPAEYADWSASGKNVATQMSEFGIQVTPRGVNQTQAPIDIDKGNFEMAIQSWGANSHPHPFFAFQADLFTHNIPIAKNNGGKGYAYELGAVPGVDGKPVDLEALVLKAGEGLDVEKQKETIGQLAQIFNEELPIIPLFERYGNNACVEGTRVKKWMDENDPIVQNPAYSDNMVVTWILNGKLESV